MTNPFDLNNYKPDLRECIPAGTPLYLRLNYTAGGADLPGLPAELKEGALTESNSSDALYLKAECTVLRGPYKGRKFWPNMTVAGGKLDEHGKSIAGNITWPALRQIMDSSLDLRVDDMTAEAVEKRKITGFKTFQGREFFAQAKIEKGTGGHADKNGLGRIITLGMNKDTPTTRAGLFELVDKPPVVGAPKTATVVAPNPTGDVTLTFPAFVFTANGTLGVSGTITVTMPAFGLAALQSRWARQLATPRIWIVGTPVGATWTKQTTTSRIWTRTV